MFMYMDMHDATVLVPVAVMLAVETENEMGMALSPTLSTATVSLPHDSDTLCSVTTKPISTSEE